MSAERSVPGPGLSAAPVPSAPPPQRSRANGPLRQGTQLACPQSSGPVLWRPPRRQPGSWGCQLSRGAQASQGCPSVFHRNSSAQPPFQKMTALDTFTGQVTILQLSEGSPVPVRVEPLSPGSLRPPSPPATFPLPPALRSHALTGGLGNGGPRRCPSPPVET